MAGQGARLQSAWAWSERGAHLPRKALEFGDVDATEQTIWADWFFAAAPPAGRVTRNTHPWTLGVSLGMGLGFPGP